MDYFERNPNEFQRPNTMPPVKVSGFAIAAIIMGVLSIVTFFSGFIAIGLGALGVLFVVLSKRKGVKMTNLQLTGLVLCCIGFALGLLFTIFTIVTVVIPVLTDPAAYAEFNNLYQQLYGVSLDEILGGRL